MIDKTGADAAEFEEFADGGRTLRIPVMGEAHKAAMVAELYRLGWSTRLIAQLCHDSHDTTLAILTRPVSGLGASMAQLSASLRQWCPGCAAATTSIGCGTCGAEVCAVCGDHGAERCETDDDETEYDDD